MRGFEIRVSVGMKELWSSLSGAALPGADFEAVGGGPGGEVARCRRARGPVAVRHTRNGGRPRETVAVDWNGRWGRALAMISGSAGSGSVQISTPSKASKPSAPDEAREGPGFAPAAFFGKVAGALMSRKSAAWRTTGDRQA